MRITPFSFCVNGIEKKILEAAKLFYARFAVLKVGEPVFFRQNNTKNDDIACGLSAIFPDFASDEEEAVVLLVDIS